MGSVSSDSVKKDGTIPEALKVKLMVRRPLNTLVEQGIVPSPKTSPSLHEQKQKLERAKMGDMLRAKIAKRPDRQELVHRHILEDVPMGVDPSLCDKQRQLKKAKLADTLSNQLSLRPGPLELIQKNILHPEDFSVEQAIKEGQIQFKPTNEGLPPKFVDLPITYTVNSNQSQSSFDEDSNSESGGVNSPPFMGGVSRSDSSDSVGKAHERRSSDAGVFAVPNSPVSGSIGTQHNDNNSSVMMQSAYSQRGAPGKDQGRKTKKSNKTTKARTIKFHEYKGPTSAQKRLSEPKKSEEETRYELLLKQQQLFLQWQLGMQHKYPKILLPAAPNSSKGDSSKLTSKFSLGSPTSTTTTNATNNRFINQQSSGSSQTSSSAPSPANSAPQTPRATTPVRPMSSVEASKIMDKIEDFKVNDLKSELKRMNLPVSGPKPVLIERLKSHLETLVSSKVPGQNRTGLTRISPAPSAPTPTVLIRSSASSTSISSSGGRGSKESSPSIVGVETPSGLVIPMDTVSQPGTPVYVQTSKTHSVDSSPQFGAIMAEPCTPPNVKPPAELDFGLDLDFDFDLMDTEAQASPQPQIQPPPPPPPPPPPQSSSANNITVRLNPVVSQSQALPVKTLMIRTPVIQLPQVPVPVSQIQHQPNLQQQNSVRVQQFQGLPAPVEGNSDTNQAEQVIKQQQQKIKELHEALKKSQLQLQEQQRMLEQQQSQLNVANNNMNGNNLVHHVNEQSHMPGHALLQQNKQLQAQIEQLQQMQVKVQQHQEAVNRSLVLQYQPQVEFNQEHQASLIPEVVTNSVVKSPIVPDLLKQEQRPFEMSSDIQADLANNTVEDLMEIIMKQDDTGSMPNFNNPMPPPPPPMPAQQSRQHHYQIQPPPQQKTNFHPQHHQHPVTTSTSTTTSPTMEILSFDLSDYELPELESITNTAMPNQANNQTITLHRGSNMDENVTMDVEQDVAGWLDSLSPTSSRSINALNEVNKFPELNGNPVKMPFKANVDPILSAQSSRNVGHCIFDANPASNGFWEGLN